MDSLAEAQAEPRQLIGQQDLPMLRFLETCTRLN